MGSKVGGPQTQSGHGDEGKKNLFLPAIEPLSSSLLTVAALTKLQNKQHKMKTGSTAIV
jgi:hypothetical protein